MSATGAGDTPVVLTRRIAAPAALVFEFLVEPEKLMRWFGVRGEVDPRAGGRFQVDVTGSDVVEGTYVEVLPDTRVVFTWGWIDSPSIPPGATTVAIDLQPDGDETVLTLAHSGLPADALAAHRAGWRYFVERLVTVAAGREPGPIDLPDIPTETQQEEELA